VDNTTRTSAKETLIRFMSLLNELYLVVNRVTLVPVLPRKSDSVH